MKAIGHGPLMGELDGWLLAMTENSSLKVIGKGIAAGLNMTTVGTGNVRGIAIGTTTTTISEARASSVVAKTLVLLSVHRDRRRRDSRRPVDASKRERRDLR